jgi:hypothetical protein
MLAHAALPFNHLETGFCLFAPRRQACRALVLDFPRKSTGPLQAARADDVPLGAPDRDLTSRDRSPATRDVTGSHVCFLV